jgi:hypothetical protein
VGVERFAAQRDEQRAGVDLAAVGRHAAKGDIRADEARAGNGRHELCERTAHQCVLNMVSRAVNASEAWSVSENGILRPLISW